MLSYVTSYSRPLSYSHLGVGDRFWLFIFTLNRAKKWFNSIFNSKLNQEYSVNKIIHSKLNQQFSFNEIIHSNWKTNQSLRNQWKTVKNCEKNMQNGAFFTQNAFFIHFSDAYALFWFIQKFILYNSKNIHSKYLIIQ